MAGVPGPNSGYPQSPPPLATLTFLVTALHAGQDTTACLAAFETLWWTESGWDPVRHHAVEDLRAAWKVFLSEDQARATPLLQRRATDAFNAAFNAEPPVVLAPDSVVVVDCYERRDDTHGAVSCTVIAPPARDGVAGLCPGDDPGFQVNRRELVADGTFRVHHRAPAFHTSTLSAVKFASTLEKRLTAHEAAGDWRPLSHLERVTEVLDRLADGTDATVKKPQNVSLPIGPAFALFAATQGYLRSRTEGRSGHVAVSIPAALQVFRLHLLQSCDVADRVRRGSRLAAIHSIGAALVSLPLEDVESTVNLNAVTSALARLRERIIGEDPGEEEPMAAVSWWPWSAKTGVAGTALTCGTAVDPTPFTLLPSLPSEVRWAWLGTVVNYLRLATGNADTRPSAEDLRYTHSAIFEATSLLAEELLERNTLLLNLDVRDGTTWDHLTELQRYINNAPSTMRHDSTSQTLPTAEASHRRLANYCLMLWAFQAYAAELKRTPGAEGAVKALRTTHRLPLRKEDLKLLTTLRPSARKAVRRLAAYLDAHATANTVLDPRGDCLRQTEPLVNQAGDVASVRKELDAWSGDAIEAWLAVQHRINECRKKLKEAQKEKDTVEAKECRHRWGKIVHCQRNSLQAQYVEGRWQQNEGPCDRCVKLDSATEALKRARAEVIQPKVLPFPKYMPDRVVFGALKSLPHLSELFNLVWAAHPMRMSPNATVIPTGELKRDHWYRVGFAEKRPKPAAIAEWDNPDFPAEQLLHYASLSTVEWFRGACDDEPLQVGGLPERWMVEPPPSPESKPKRGNRAMAHWFATGSAGNPFPLPDDCARVANIRCTEALQVPSAVEAILECDATVVTPPRGAPPVALTARATIAHAVGNVATAWPANTSQAQAALLKDAVTRLCNAEAARTRLIGDHLPTYASVVAALVYDLDGVDGVGALNEQARLVLQQVEKLELNDGRETAQERQTRIGEQAIRAGGALCLFRGHHWKDFKGATLATYCRLLQRYADCCTVKDAATQQTRTDIVEIVDEAIHDTRPAVQLAIKDAWDAKDETYAKVLEVFTDASPGNVDMKLKHDGVWWEFSRKDGGSVRNDGGSVIAFDVSRGWQYIDGRRSNRLDADVLRDAGFARFFGERVDPLVKPAVFGGSCASPLFSGDGWQSQRCHASALGMHVETNCGNVVRIEIGRRCPNPVPTSMALGASLAPPPTSNLPSSADVAPAGAAGNISELPLWVVNANGWHTSQSEELIHTLRQQSPRSLLAVSEWTAYSDERQAAVAKAVAGAGLTALSNVRQDRAGGGAALVYDETQWVCEEVKKYVPEPDGDLQRVVVKIRALSPAGTAVGDAVVLYVAYATPSDRVDVAGDIRKVMDALAEQGLPLSAVAGDLNARHESWDGSLTPQHRCPRYNEAYHYQALPRGVTLDRLFRFKGMAVKSCPTRPQPRGGPTTALDIVASALPLCTVSTEPPRGLTDHWPMLVMLRCARAVPPKTDVSIALRVAPRDAPPDPREYPQGRNRFVRLPEGAGSFLHDPSQLPAPLRHYGADALEYFACQRGQETFVVARRPPIADPAVPGVMDLTPLGTAVGVFRLDTFGTDVVLLDDSTAQLRHEELIAVARARVDPSASKYPAVFLDTGAARVGSALVRRLSGFEEPDYVCCGTCVHGSAPHTATVVLPRFKLAFTQRDFSHFPWFYECNFECNRKPGYALHVDPLPYDNVALPRWLWRLDSPVAHLRPPALVLRRVAETDVDHGTLRMQPSHYVLVPAERVGDVPSEGVTTRAYHEYAVHKHFKDLRPSKGPRARLAALHLASIYARSTVPDNQATGDPAAMRTLRRTMSNAPLNDAEVAKLEEVATAASPPVFLLCVLLWRVSDPREPEGPLPSYPPTVANVRRVRAACCALRDALDNGSLPEGCHLRAEEWRFLFTDHVKLPPELRPSQPPPLACTQFALKQGRDALDKYRGALAANVTRQPGDGCREDGADRLLAAVSKKLEEKCNSVAKETLDEIRASHRGWLAARHKGTYKAKDKAKGCSTIYDAQAAVRQALSDLDKALFVSLNDDVDDRLRDAAGLRHRPCRADAATSLLLSHAEQQDEVLERPRAFDTKVLVTWLELCVAQDHLARVATLFNDELTGDELALHRELEPRDNTFEDAFRKRVHWLLLEAEMRLRIRPQQYHAVRHLTSAKDEVEKHRRGVALQLNMGEGKTQVIVPMLVLDSLYSPVEQDRCVLRVTLLSSLLGEAFDNYSHALQHTAFTVRISCLPFHRHTIDAESVSGWLNPRRSNLRFLLNNGFLLQSREAALAFIQKERELRFDGKPREELVTASAAKAWWVNPPTHQPTNPHSDPGFTPAARLARAKEVYDEADELLSPRCPLLYTIGTSQSLPDSATRYEVIPEVLRAVSLCAEDAVNKGLAVAHGDCAWDAQTHFRSLLFRDIAAASPSQTPESKGRLQQWYRGILKHLRKASFFREGEWGDNMEASLCDSDLSFKAEHLAPAHSNRLLLVRGLLGEGVLLHCLSRRPGVHYGRPGLNRKDRKRIAVPYEAADVPSDRSEFAQPDVAITFSLLAYFDAGLTEAQFLDALTMLKEDKTTTHNKKQSLWREWCTDVPSEKLKDAGATKEDLSSVSLKFPRQRADLYNLFRRNMRVVSYWLKRFVFPRDLPHFPKVLTASAFDLVASSKRPMGFSGTKDLRFVVPLRQLTESELCPDAAAASPTGGAAASADDGDDMLASVAADFHVMHQLSQHVLLNPDGAVVEQLELEQLPVDAATGSPTALVDAVLSLAVKRDCTAIIDRGALLAGLHRRTFAHCLCNKPGFLSGKDLKGVLFHDGTAWCVMDAATRVVEPRGAHHPDSDCFAVFDEAQCRGADLQLRPDAVAMLTLGAGLTKANLMQATWRLRRLGRRQKIRLCAPPGMLPDEWFAGGAPAEPLTRTEQIGRLVAWATMNGVCHVHQQLPHWATLLGTHLKHDAQGKPPQGKPPVDVEVAGVAKIYGKPRVPRELHETVAAPLKAELDANEGLAKAVEDMCRGERAVATTVDREMEREVAQVVEQEREIEVQRAEKLTAKDEQLNTSLDTTLQDPHTVLAQVAGVTVRMTPNFQAMVDEQPPLLKGGFCSTAGVGAFVRHAEYVVTFPLQHVLATPREVARYINEHPLATNVLHWRSREVRGFLQLFNGDVDRLPESILRDVVDGHVLSEVCRQSKLGNLSGEAAVRFFLRCRRADDQRYSGSDLHEQFSQLPPAC